MSDFDNGETTPKQFTCEFCGDEGAHALNGHLCDYDDLLTIVAESKDTIATQQATIDELERQLALANPKYEDGQSVNPYVRIAEAKATIERLQAERQWISVEDRLPSLTKESWAEYSDDVLFTDGYERFVGVYNDGCDWINDGCDWICNSGTIVVGVTHWMPLPAPPGEK